MSITCCRFSSVLGLSLQAPRHMLSAFPQAYASLPPSKLLRPPYTQLLTVAAMMFIPCARCALRDVPYQLSTSGNRPG